MSFYNKYRPKNFSDIKGSKSALLLEKQILNKKTTHAYIFSGPPGTGKTTLARVAAASLLSQDTDDVETISDMVLSDNHPDVYEINCAVNNGVDNIRENIIQLARMAPTSGKYKIFILDECHMLTNQAQTSLIKITEEPPKFVKFFFCTTDPNKILRAIQTRCQIFPMNRLTENDLSDLLIDVCDKENLSYETSALKLISKEAEGSARTALSILEQASMEEISDDNIRMLLNRSPRQVSEKLTSSIINIDRAEATRIIISANIEGRNMSALLLECSNMFLAAYKYMVLRTTKENRDPFIESICKTVKSSEIIEISEQLYNISNNIRQTVSEDIVSITGVLKIIDYYARTKA